MTREETKKAIEEYIKDYSTGDFRMALDKHYTPDAVFENTRVRIVGKDNIVDWFTRSHALGYTERIVPVNILIGEDSVAVELAQTFTALEDVPNHYVCALSKGDTITTSGLAGFYKMKDGKIRSIKVYCTLSEYNPRVFGPHGILTGLLVIEAASFFWEADKVSIGLHSQGSGGRLRFSSAGAGQERTRVNL